MELSRSERYAVYCIREDSKDNSHGRNRLLLKIMPHSVPVPKHWENHHLCDKRRNTIRGSDICNWSQQLFFKSTIIIPIIAIIQYKCIPHPVTRGQSAMEKKAAHRFSYQAAWNGVERTNQLDFQLIILQHPYATAVEETTSCKAETWLGIAPS